MEEAPQQQASSSDSDRLLEINLISAQELKPQRKSIISKTMHTYVVAWIDPNRKLKSRIDVLGRENPSWNDKFVFVLDDQILNNINSTLVIEIYIVRILRMDKNIGTVRILLSNLLGCSNRYYEGSLQGTFRSFQIRHPIFGEPQGILNIGIMILDGMCSEMMNKFMGVIPSVDYKELMSGSMKLVKKKRDLSMISCVLKQAFCGLLAQKRSSSNEFHQWPL